MYVRRSLRNWLPCTKLQMTSISLLLAWPKRCSPVAFWVPPSLTWLPISLPDSKQAIGFTTKMEAKADRLRQVRIRMAYQNASKMCFVFRSTGGDPQSEYGIRNLQKRWLYPTHAATCLPTSCEHVGQIFILLTLQWCSFKKLFQKPTAAVFYHPIDILDPVERIINS